MLRVGHKGADLIEPGNTPASFDAALAHGVDMIELDVLPERGGGRLILAHDYEDAGRSERRSRSRRASRISPREPFESIELIVDLKLPGYELRGARGARRARPDGARRSSRRSTRRACSASAAAGSAVRLGWSVPRARRDYTRSPLLAGPALRRRCARCRLVLPGGALPRIRAGCATRSSRTGGS